MVKWLKKRFPNLEEMLQHLYVNQELTMVQIAKKLGVSPIAVCDQLHKFDIPTRTLRSRLPNLKELLEDLYINQHLTMAKIGKKIDVSACTICKQLHKLGIPTRTEWALLHPNLTPSRELAYILGVLKGDGCVSKFKGGRTWQYQIVLQVADRKFALAFKRALDKIDLHAKFDKTIQRSPRYFGRRMYRVIARSKMFYNWYVSLSLANIEKTLTEKSFVTSFIKGFYESEGYALKSKNKNAGNWFRCRIAIYNTDYDLLKLVKRLLERLGFCFSLYPMKNTPSPLGTFNKQRFELVTSKKETFRKFFATVKPITKLPNIIQ